MGLLRTSDLLAKIYWLKSAEQLYKPSIQQQFQVSVPFFSKAFDKS